MFTQVFGTQCTDPPSVRSRSRFVMGLVKLVFLLGVGCFGTLAQADTSEGIEAWLKQLFDSTGGPNWTENTGWDHGSSHSRSLPMCHWYGVSCTYKNYIDENGVYYHPMMVSIEIGNNNLKGSLPSFQSPDSSYYVPRDPHNNPYDSAHSYFREYPDPNGVYLESITISGNPQLSGSIPNFRSPYLISLRLNHNHFTGTIPDFDLPSLRFLDLGGNQLEAFHPEFKLPNWRQIDLRENLLSGRIPQIDFSPLEESNWGPNRSDNMFYLDRNCVLIPYDDVQKEILNRNGSSWKNINPDCTFTVTVNKNGNGSGTVSSGKYGDKYVAGEMVILTAVPDENSVFMGWSPSPCADSFVMPSNNLTCTANFAVIVPNTTDCNAVTEIPAAECQELLRLYNSTDGANWKDKTGWNQTNTPCRWKGISCARGHVTVVALPYKNLKGLLPDLKLPNLYYLGLSDNQLSGTIPNFKNSPKLEQLTLGRNQLSGKIPNFKNLPKLSTLSLPRNQLSGSIPDFNKPDGSSYLPELQFLSLGFNQLVGSVPDLNLPKLHDLYLLNNRLSGDIPVFHKILQSFNAYYSDNCGLILNGDPLPMGAHCGGTLIVSKIGGNGIIVSNPAGINCGTDCTETYTPGTTVNLIATPDTGYKLIGWSPARCASSFVMPNRSLACVAIFDDILTLATLGSFTATSTLENIVMLQWNTEAEHATAGFNVWRAEPPSGANCQNTTPENFNNVTQLTEKPIPATGSLYNGATYSYVDNTGKNQTDYCYALEEIDNSGKSIFYLDYIISAK